MVVSSGIALKVLETVGYIVAEYVSSTYCKNQVPASLVYTSTHCLY